LAVFALQDNLRDGVKAAIKFANKASITVRMVSGDSLETAKAVAINAGILSTAEAEQKYVCMMADEFRKLVGPVKTVTVKNQDGSETETHSITNKKAFD
jgi:P-type Ca2+ transporter type 2C